MDDYDVVYKRTEELYQLNDKMREYVDMKVEKALDKQKEYLKEVVKSASANTKLWIIAQGLATCSVLVAVVKLV